MSAQHRHALEQSAVKSSFWLGGVALIALKGVAYAMSSSSLIKASMFESIGDVLSSAIMAVTQARVADASDHHLYPVGKRRLTPLGVLVFAAFAASTMCGLATQSLQSLLSGPEAQDSTPALRRLFAEQPHLSRGLGPQQLEALVAKYGAAAEEEAASARSPLLLVAICIAVKGSLQTWCSGVARKTGSEIAKTLAADHWNDVVSNIAVMAVMGVVSTCKRVGRNWPWLEKLDPAASLVLALWIAYNWISTALEQVHVLSNRRADDGAVAAIMTGARNHLDGGPLELAEADVYHVGEGYEAVLHLRLRPRRKPSPEELTAALEALEEAVRASCAEVSEVHIKLHSDKAREATAGDAAWVSGYAALGP